MTAFNPICLGQEQNLNYYEKLNAGKFCHNESLQTKVALKITKGSLKKCQRS